MILPITNYNVTTRDILECIFSILALVFGILGSVIIVNKITGLVSSKQKNLDDRKLNIFILSIHIVVILIFIMLIRYVLKQIIINSLILESAFSFIGPMIALSSLYLSTNIKYFVDLTK